MTRRVSGDHASDRIGATGATDSTDWMGGNAMSGRAGLTAHRANRTALRGRPERDVPNLAVHNPPRAQRAYVSTVRAVKILAAHHSDGPPGRAEDPSVSEVADDATDPVVELFHCDHLFRAPAAQVAPVTSLAEVPDTADWADAITRVEFVLTAAWRPTPHAVTSNAAFGRLVHEEQDQSTTQDRRASLQTSRHGGVHRAGNHSPQTRD